MLEQYPMLFAFLVYASAHFLGDFAFQSVWMIMEKAKDWEVLLYHVCTYTATVVIVGLPAPQVTHVSLGGIVVVFVSHYFIDTFVKGWWGVTTKIWIDQLCHLGVLAVLVWAGWL